MPPKRSVQSESIVTPAVTVDPLHMVALISGDDEVFLVDRNCASVSQRCRRYMDEVERLVVSAAANTPGMEMIFDSTFDSSSHGRNSSACTTPNMRGSLHGPRASDQTTPGAHEDEDAAWSDVRIPFCDYEALQTSASRAPLEQVPISELLEACRKMALSRQGSAVQQPDGQRPASGRKSMSTTHRPHTRPFIALTGANGHHLYPAIELPDVPSQLLTLGIVFMYHKYQADNDSEKRSHTMPSVFTDSDTAALIAISTLLAM